MLLAEVKQEETYTNDALLSLDYGLTLVSHSDPLGKSHRVNLATKQHYRILT